MNRCRITPIQCPNRPNCRRIDCAFVWRHFFRIIYGLDDLFTSPPPTPPRSDRLCGPHSLLSYFDGVKRPKREAVSTLPISFVRINLVNRSTGCPSVQSKQRRAEWAGLWLCNGESREQRKRRLIQAALLLSRSRNNPTWLNGPGPVGTVLNQFLTASECSYVLRVVGWVQPCAETASNTLCAHSRDCTQEYVISSLVITFLTQRNLICMLHELHGIGNSW
jgi:hypothetical protein